MAINLYELLLVKWGADEAEIRHQIAQAEKTGSIEPGLLNAARAALLNPTNRARYDEQLTKQYADQDKKKAEEERRKQQQAQKEAEQQRIIERNQSHIVHYEYKTVALPTLSTKITAPAIKKAVDGLQQTIDQNAKNGWEYYRTDPVNVYVNPGCMAGLMGASIATVSYNVAVFRRPIGA